MVDDYFYYYNDYKNRHRENQRVIDTLVTFIDMSYKKAVMNNDLVQIDDRIYIDKLGNRIVNNKHKYETKKKKIRERDLTAIMNMLHHIL